ncbi:MAG: antirestriction protein ArdA [Lachnospiraceae bacterium]|nr:antirestriction protein ArdA [Lachnospiraceae bacterium]
MTLTNAVLVRICKQCMKNRKKGKNPQNRFRGSALQADPLLEKGKVIAMKFEYGKDYPFAACITNLGKYNEGELIGEWVKFPASQKELAATLKRIGIGEKDEFVCPYEEWFITDYDCYIPGLYKVAGEYESIDELNMLAKKLVEMPEDDFFKFSAAIEAGEGGSSLQDLINLAGNLDYFIVYPDIKNEKDLGRYYLEESGIYDLSAIGRLADYIDTERFGRDVSLEEGGTFTNYGYVLSDASNLPVIYDGEDVPEEYRIMGKALEYLKNAEMSFEDDCNMIDGLVNNGPKPGSGRETEEKAAIAPPYEGRMSVREALMKICEGCCLKETRKDISRLSRSKAEPVL